jgi:dipeptidyl aminopeptidase/acylaminoacyl peptidase
MANERDKMLDIERLVRVPSVLDGRAGYDVAPDGHTAAVAWNKSGQWELYLVDLDGDRALRLITSVDVPEGKVAPHWSPDGRRLAYAQDHDGDERYDIYVYDLESGRHRNVTPDTPEYLSASVSWSPDGAWLAVSATREDRFGIWTLPVEPGLSRNEGREWTRISDHPHSDDEPLWSPRGDWIAFVANTEGQNYALFLAPPNGGAVREARLPGGAPLFALSPAWSPDGRRLAFVGGPRDLVDLGVYEVATGAITWVEQGEYECAVPAWSPDGRRLAYGVNVDGDLRLFVADLASGEKRDLSRGPGVHEAPQWADDGRVLFTYSGPGHPPDLWIAELDGAQPRYRQLTRSLPEELADYKFEAPIHIGYSSLEDRALVRALLYMPRFPPRGQKRPLVIQIHGGPAWQRMNTWYPEIQWLLARGCAVLCPNYRGSTGYGRVYMEANRFVMGDADLKDVVGGIDWIAENMFGVVNTNRVAVTGWSYGGYLTMMCLTKYPDRFVAGSAGIPFLNWILAADEERDDLRHWDRENMGDPVKDAERLRAASPIHYMDQISAPVQFIGGANDPRCPISQVHEAQAVMERLGKPFEVVIYPDEGHGFLKIENNVDAERRWAGFLARHLGLHEPDEGSPGG